MLLVQLVQVVLLLGRGEQPPLVARQLVAMEHLLTLHHVHVLVSGQGIAHPRELVQVVVGCGVRPLLLIGCSTIFQALRLAGRFGHLQQPDLLRDVVGGGQHLSRDARNAARKPEITFC